MVLLSFINTYIPNGTMIPYPMLPVFSQSHESFDVGIIGAGRAASILHLSVLNNINSLDIKYIADIDSKGQRGLTRNYGGTPITISEGPKELPDCDVVLLTTPVGVREEYISEFSMRGTPIFSEKPFAIDFEKHREFEKLSSRIICNYLRTHFSSVNQIRRMIETNIFGNLEHVEISEGGIIGSTGRSQGSYHQDVTLSGGGILMQTGCHLLSELCHVMHDWDISVHETEIRWYNKFDIDIEARLEATKHGHSVDIDFQLSHIRPINNKMSFFFSESEITYDPSVAGENIKIVSQNGQGRTFNVDLDDKYAQSMPQAVFLRWKLFLYELINGSKFDKTSNTFPNVTRLISEMYEQGGDRRGFK